MAEVIDPFGAAPAPAPEEAQQVTPPSDPWQTTPAAPAPVVLGSGEGKVVLTFKRGANFSDPWVVVHADSLDEALKFVTEDGAKLADLFTRVSRAANTFHGEGGSSPAPVQRQAAPAAAMDAPAGAPASPGPGWQYKTGITKSGKNQGKQWHAWMPPQHLKDSADPMWFDL